MVKSALTVEDIRNERLRRERNWYLSEDGFLDYCKDSGAAPDAQWEPHGIEAQNILNWNGEEDLETDGRINYKYKMVLWPRGAFKSTVFDIAYASWLIARNPNIRILVCSETAKQARAFVEQCKDIIDSKWYQDLFGKHRGKDWKQGSFVSNFRSDPHLKEPTLQATGVGEVRTGAHWDFVIMDDVCSQENTKTSESIEGLWFWFGETLAQLDPGGKLLMIGTLHHYNDLYCRIQKDPAMSKRFEFSIHSWCDPISEDPDINRGEKLFFPGRLTRSYVSAQKAFMPPRLFACFYLNQPMAGSDQVFKPEYFNNQVINDDDIPSAVWTYIFTDFAFIAEEKKKGKADRTCFWVVSLDVNRYAYVRDFYVGRWKPSDSVKIACDLWNRYHHLNMKGIVVEDTTHKELLVSLFEQVRRDTFVHPKIIPIGGRSQEVKDYRIEAIQPKFFRNEFYFAQSLRSQYIRKWKPLVSEMTEWPFSKHDDIPDAISDVDKRDKDNKLYCPGPPVGWRTQPITTHKPPTLGGRYNPDYGYPAEEFTKANHGAAQRGSSLWNQNLSSKEDAQTQRSQSIFQRPPPPPTKLGGF